MLRAGFTLNARDEQVNPRVGRWMLSSLATGRPSVLHQLPTTPARELEMAHLDDSRFHTISTATSISSFREILRAQETTPLINRDDVEAGPARHTVNASSAASTVGESLYLCPHHPVPICLLSSRRCQAHKNTRQQVRKETAILRTFDCVDPELLILSASLRTLTLPTVVLILVQPRWRCARWRVTRCYAYTSVGQLRHLASQAWSNRWSCKKPCLHLIIDWMT